MGVPVAVLVPKIQAAGRAFFGRPFFRLHRRWYTAAAGGFYRVDYKIGCRGTRCWGP